MTEYIRRDYVNEIMFYYARGQEDKTKDLLSIIAQSIYTLPNADVVERKRGKWVKDEDGCVCCSLCGNPCEINGITGEFLYSPFCSECGADMREPKESEP